MIPAGLHDFLVATVTASASFIGLLFVAISFVMNDERDKPADTQTKRVLAESSYAALLSIFFISLVALIPGANVGWVIFALAWAGIGNVLHLFRGNALPKQNYALITFSALLYVVQGIYGIYTIVAGDSHIVNKYWLMTLMIFLFSLALGRAWELTGIRRA